MKYSAGFLKLFSSLFIMLMILIIFPVKSDAAEEHLCTYVGTEHQKVGRYYYWTAKSRGKYNLYCSFKKNGKGQLLFSTKHMDEGWIEILADNKKVYLIEQLPYKSSRIYSVNINGKGLKKHGTIKGYDISFVNLYGKTLYLSGISGTYALALKTNTVKRVSSISFNEDAFQQIIGCHRWVYNIDYNYNEEYEGADNYLLDCKTGKAAKVAADCTNLMFSGNNFYYTIWGNNFLYYYSTSKMKSTKISVYKSSAKNVSISFEGSSFPCIYYWVEENGEESGYFKYNVKTKKNNEISAKEYNKVCH